MTWLVQGEGGWNAAGLTKPRRLILRSSVQAPCATQEPGTARPWTSTYFEDTYENILTDKFYLWYIPGCRVTPSLPERSAKKICFEMPAATNRSRAFLF